MKSLLIRLGVTLVIIGLALFNYAEVWAEDWRLYAKTDLYECFYNAEDMIRSSQDIVEVLTKLVYTERGVVEMVKEFGKHYENLSYSLELWEINCAEKKHRLLSTTTYSVEGNILYTNQAGSRPPPWKIISRESVEESLYKALCK
ncbi:MAG: surface-adhesin E family protein [Candidatus Bathyarchaeia archaeon]|jgi:hypothetical protein